MTASESIFSFDFIALTKKSASREPSPHSEEMKDQSSSGSS